MDTAELPFLSAVELARLIETKEVSPVEVTEAYLERIATLDFQFNAYLTVCRKDALHAARQAEQEILRGQYRGPMHGIPVAVKDQFWTKGIRSTGGSRILADFLPDEDATVIANLHKAGAVLLGKTNLTEFAITGFSHRFSTPRNPWSLDMYTGGSSSGSGAATAAFLCATSLGEDTGGSIRFPATWCGLVGLRPSWGLVSRYGVMRGVWSMDTVGPISRTVADAAITLGAIAGHDPKDPYTWQAPVPDYRQALDGNIRGLKVGVISEQLSSELVEPEVGDAVAKATVVLGELGAVIDEVSLPLTTHAGVISSVLLNAEAAASHRDWVRTRLADYGHDNRIGLLTGSLLPAQAYYKAQRLRSLLRQQVLAALQRYDVLVTPTAGKPAQRLEDDPVITSKETASRLSFLLTRPFNLASTPAISVPCGFSAQHLPIGLQIGGRPGGEATLLKIAHAYEQQTPWHTMRPPAACGGR
jgi:aspartyl-tRNA(Asn)/glutamyl-tRNA(Gln) amidotransferase subunit A